MASTLTTRCLAGDTIGHAMAVILRETHFRSCTRRERPRLLVTNRHLCDAATDADTIQTLANGVSSLGRMCLPLGRVYKNRITIWRPPPVRVEHPQERRKRRNGTLQRSLQSKYKRGLLGRESGLARLDTPCLDLTMQICTTKFRL